MVLPSEDEDITAQQVADVIAATEWEPIKEVVLVLAGDIFYLQDSNAPKLNLTNNFEPCRVIVL